MHVWFGAWHQAHPCPTPNPHPRVVDVQGFEITPETSWYPSVCNTKLKIMSSVLGVPHLSSSCIHSAYVYWAGGDGHPHQVDSCYRDEMPCQRSQHQFSSTFTIVTDSVPGVGTLCLLHLTIFSQQAQEAEINILIL